MAGVSEFSTGDRILLRACPREAWTVREVSPGQIIKAELPREPELAPIVMVGPAEDFIQAPAGWRDPPPLPPLGSTLGRYRFNDWRTRDADPADQETLEQYQHAIAQWDREVLRPFLAALAGEKGCGAQHDRASTEVCDA